MADAKTTGTAVALAAAIGGAFVAGDKLGSDAYTVTASPVAVSAKPIDDPQTVSKIVGIHVQVPCPACAGKGEQPSRHPPSAARGVMDPCPVCRGHGSTLETVTPATLKAMLGVQ